MTDEDLLFLDNEGLRLAALSAIDSQDLGLLSRIGKRFAERGCRREDRKQANELLAAGWTIVLPDSHDAPVMAWYWRRPPKRVGSKGRLFMSTNQAWNAMRKETS
jgi:hypothetical protein